MLFGGKDDTPPLPIRLNKCSMPSQMVKVVYLLNLMVVRLILRLVDLLNLELPQ